MSTVISRSPATILPDGAPALEAVLHTLFEELESNGQSTVYTRMHATPKAITNHVRTFQWYQPYLPARGAILDWACQHAPDSSLLRAAFGDRYSLHGCDVVAPGLYPPFFDHSGLDYTCLQDLVKLPYPSGMFDAVIGSGALEHVAMDYESLKEVHRIMKPGGILILTYLPNWLSVSEWYLRVIRKSGFHHRLYGRAETRWLLKHTGFYPLRLEYHNFFWERTLRRISPGHCPDWLPNLCATLMPVQTFCSTLRVVAQRRYGM